MMTNRQLFGLVRVEGECGRRSETADHERFGFPTFAFSPS